MVRADHRERARGRRELVQTLERVLEHRVVSEQAAVLLRDATAKAALHVFLQPAPVAPRQRQRPIEMNCIALDWARRRRPKYTTIEREHRPAGNAGSVPV